MSNKVIVTAAAHPYLLEALSLKGFEVVYEPTIDAATLAASIQDAVGLIVTTRLKIDANILSGATQLK